MKKLVIREEMRYFDEKTIKEKGICAITLMERAAKAALTHLKSSFDTTRVLFLCGSGNNGGDGFAMARFFADEGGKCEVCYLGKMENGKPDTGAMSSACAAEYALLPSGVKLSDTPCLDGVSAVVDAVFGTGLCREIGGHIAEVLTAVRASSLPVLAIDIPSGIDASTGAVLGVALPATLTVAIEAIKAGHLLFPGTLLCGKIEVVEIGIDIEDTCLSLLEKSDISLLSPRPCRSHKGTFGRVLIVGGSPDMSGAAHLAAKAAYRAGAGLVEMLVPGENKTVHQILLPEAIITTYHEKNAATQMEAALCRADAVAIGMGLSQSNTAAALVEVALRDSSKPILFDADALNLIAARQELLALLYARHAPSVLTPHLSEMSRLSGKAVSLIAADMRKSAVDYASATGATVVLKDARTVIADGEHAYLNTFGNNGMATGGSGDTLAGIIAAFLAAKEPAPLAAAIGVLAHALAGDVAKEAHGAHGLMASDIIEGLSQVLP